MKAQPPRQTTICLANGVELKGFLEGTEQARGLIVFVHGSGSCSLSAWPGHSIGWQTAKTSAGCHSASLAPALAPRPP